MPTFTWSGDPEGRTFDLITNPTFAEIAWVEKQSRQDWDDMSSVLRGLAGLLLSMRRAGVMLSWADGEAMSPAEFDVRDDADPTPTGVEAGTAKVSPRRRGAPRTMADKNRKAIIAAGGVPPVPDGSSSS